jgi:diaminopimelate epimerase
MKKSRISCPDSILKSLEMNLKFWKMHGLGNDFILLDSRKTGFVPKPARVRKWCHRRFGIGADQMLILLPSSCADFRMRIFNADGSEAQMCGNGIRCLVRFIHDRKISRKKKLAIETLAGIVYPEILGKSVRVNMGTPVFEPQRIPANLAGSAIGRPLEVNGNLFEITVLSMGNPHCVIPVQMVEGVWIEHIGPLVERHKLFPQGTNVEFVQVSSRKKLKVRVWERGVGETLACGTGACAAAVACAKAGLSERKVTVSLPGGDLKINWQEHTGNVFMTGPAEFVFEGIKMGSEL